MKITLSICTALFLLMGCASVPEDYGKSDVYELLTNRNLPFDTIGDENPEKHIKSILENPINLHSTSQLVLLNNADLKKAYARLGFAAADVYEASRIRNPIFSSTS